jgi:hypothetical protein
MTNYRFEQDGIDLLGGGKESQADYCRKNNQIDNLKNLQLSIEKGITPVYVEAGVKFDEGKIRYDLIPPEALEGLAWILTFGATKYGDRNWEKGMNWGRPFAALMRHMWAWWRGEEKDTETGKSHLWHAITNIAFLITYEQRKTGKDDRGRKD